MRAADGIEYTVEWRIADVAPEKLFVTVTLRNTTDQPIRLEFPYCPLTLQVFDGLRRLRFNSSEWTEAATGTLRGCSFYSADKDLAPREFFAREDLEVVVPIYEIIGHPLLGWTQPDGLYDVRAIIKLDPKAGRGNDYGRMVEIPLGEVLLRAERASMPATRLRGDILYMMNGPSPGSPATSTVRVQLNVVNYTDGPVEASVSPDCLMTVYAFTDRAKANAAYLYSVAKPDWVLPREPCTPQFQSLSLGPRKTQLFTFEADATQALREAPPGRFSSQAYIFVASVPMPDAEPLLLWAGTTNLGL